MPLETLQDVRRLCNEFCTAVEHVNPTQVEQMRANKEYKQETLNMAGGILGDTFLYAGPCDTETKIVTALYDIAISEIEAEQLTRILPQDQVARQIPVALKKPENVETLRLLGATNLAALCTLKL
jgi:hypothetical protein